MEYEKALEFQKIGYKIVKTPNMIHFAKLLTPNGKFVEWVESPRKSSMRTKTSKYSAEDVMEFHGFEGKPFCFFCGRTQDELGVGETLTLDHIVPLREGGKDELGNLQILCLACHKLRHWSELYVTKHLVRKEKNQTSGYDQSLEIRRYES